MDTSNAPKGMRPVDLGPTGEAVAAALRWHRQWRDLTYAGLERRTEELGNRIPVLGLRSIEARSRRVSVDDLTTLAAALNISPIELMLWKSPDDPAPDETTWLTGLPEIFLWGEARAWLRGDVGLTTPEREAYWRSQVEVLSATAQRDRKQIDKLRNLLGASGEVGVADRLRAAEMYAVDTDRALAEAEEQLAAVAGEMEATDRQRQK